MNRFKNGVTFSRKMWITMAYFLEIASKFENC